MGNHSSEHYLPEKSLIDVPHIITEIKTNGKYAESMSLLSDEEFWIQDDDNILRLFNLQRELLKSS